MESEEIRLAVSERDTPEARRRKRIAHRMFEALAGHFPPGEPLPRFRVPVPVLRECSLLQADWWGVDGRLYDVVVKSVTHD